MVSEARSGVTKHGYGAGCNLHAAILRVRLRAARAQRKDVFGSDSSDDHDEDS